MSRPRSRRAAAALKRQALDLPDEGAYRRTCGDGCNGCEECVDYDEQPEDMYAGEDLEGDGQ